MAWDHISLKAFDARENRGGSLSCYDHDRLLPVSMFNQIALLDCWTKVRRSIALRFIETGTRYSIFDVGLTVCLLFALLVFDLFDGSAHLSRLI